MKIRNHIAKCIPLSILIHGGAIIAAGFLIIPKNISSPEAPTEVQFHNADLGDIDTLGENVEATQGDAEQPVAPSVVKNEVAVPTKTLPVKAMATNTMTSKPQIVSSAPVEQPAVAAEAIETTTPELAAADVPVAVAPAMSEVATVKKTEDEPIETPSLAAKIFGEADEELKAPVSTTALASTGMGAGTNGENLPSQTLAGTESGIRSLAQLRQIPGNAIPRYSRDERLKGHQGLVIFKAFITSDGRPTDIVKITSSGHTNLDTKSQAALEKWKFQAGQEGWVEVPFKWDLKGSTQEDASTLRSAVGTRQAID